jgi:uncharacterized protein
MNSDKQAPGFDVQAFARSGGVRSEDSTLAKFPRLLDEAAGASGDRAVHWRAEGALRLVAGVPQTWLHLEVQAALPSTCQRCLEPVDLALSVDRWFRFVADEATADAEDEEAEEDVLVLDPQFDLLALIEDELLMAMPLVPRHDVCPTAVPMEHVDPGFEDAQQAKPNPFNALAGLKIGPDKDEH